MFLFSVLVIFVIFTGPVWILQKAAEFTERNKRHTAVTNITKTRMSQKYDFIHLTFRMLQHTSSEVTVEIITNKFKSRLEDWSLIGKQKQ